MKSLKFTLYLISMEIMMLQGGMAMAQSLEHVDEASYDGAMTIDKDLVEDVSETGIQTADTVHLEQGAVQENEKPLELSDNQVIAEIKEDPADRFITQCQWVQAEPDRQMHRWLEACDDIYQFCYPNQDGMDKNDLNDVRQVWSETVYGQLLCQDLMRKCSNAGIDFEHLKQESDGEIISWQQKVEIWADRVCESWSHCVNQTPQVNPDEDTFMLAADGLSSLGFRIKNEDHKLQIKAEKHGLNAVVVQDRILSIIQSLYEVLRQNAWVELDDVLSKEIGLLFDSSDNSLSAGEKLTILETILPDLVHHATQSGAVAAARRLRDSWNSLNTQFPGAHYDIACIRQRNHENIEMHFPASVLNGENYTNVTVTRSLLCPDKNGLYMDQQAGSEDKLYCQSVLVQNESQDEVKFFEKALNDAWHGLTGKDNDSIAEAMGRIVDGLNLLNHRYGYIASWNDYWSHAPVESWMCQIQTIELMALEQQRMAELARLERTLQSVFGKTTFYQRLSQYESCIRQIDGDFGAAAKRLWSDHHGDYEWIIRHFAPKSLKKLDSNFNTWTRRVSKPVVLLRSLIASWTAWSNQDYKAASRFAFDVTDNRSALVHPQLNSYHRLLDVIQNGTPDRQLLEQYARLILLKTPALAYQTLSEAGYFLDKSGRSLVVDVVRQYPATLSPHEAARFYVMYENEFNRGMDSHKKIEIAAWIERERALYESDLQKKKRRMSWLKELCDLEDWTGIAQMSDYILSTDVRMSDQMRSHFIDISHYAHILTSRDETEETHEVSWRTVPDEAYDQCIQKVLGNSKGKESAKLYFSAVVGCING